ncbi:hypothetical protein SAMN04487820_101221 [Actinopolyspora mzabensis]|uniref:Uncharacterized protein n=1 Tax=Actinopolyspora mzabensis TaxID=995066 RepID=A0A1G8VPC5_ACTMZ|nr:hypothetical protein [Actinopolyspora mzabensis]SDJ67737.1 hypothetical protein SAMN04487820_101221 [Actinopolyspora mzabensis]
MSDDQSVANAAARSHDNGPLWNSGVLLLLGSIGLLSGAFAAFGFYHRLLNPFAHALTPWVLLAVLVSARRTPRAAVPRTIACLLGAVVAFYVGKPLLYNIVYYPDAPDIGIQVSNLVMWCVLAMLAGAVLGAVFSAIGGASWSGSAATATAIALLLAATIEETGFGFADSDVLLLLCCGCAVLLTLHLADTRDGRLRRIGVLTPPLLVAGFVLVVAPDLLQRMTL